MPGGVEIARLVERVAVDEALPALEARRVFLFILPLSLSNLYSTPLKTGIPSLS